MKNNPDYMSNQKIADYVNQKMKPNVVYYLDRTTEDTDPGGLETMFTEVMLDTFETKKDKLADNIKYK